MSGRDPGVGCPEHDFSGLWVDQPSVLVVGLVRQRSGDLLQVKAAQIKHRTTLTPAQSAAGDMSYPDGSDME